jgi:hypothetical protein
LFPFQVLFVVFVLEHGVHAGPKDYIAVVVVVRGFPDIGKITVKII